jgi:hypothetical protein
MILWKYRTGLRVQGGDIGSAMNEFYRAKVPKPAWGTMFSGDRYGFPKIGDRNEN